MKENHFAGLKCTHTKSVHAALTPFQSSQLFLSMLICGYEVGMTTIFPNNYVTHGSVDMNQS